MNNNENKINWFKVIGVPLISIAAAVLLIISPIDVIPDAVPYAGLIDDIGYGASGLAGVIAPIVSEIKRVKNSK